MSDIVKGVGNLFASVAEIIQGIFVTIFNVIRSAFAAVFDVIQGAFNAFIGLIQSTFNLAEGALGFVIGNFFIIALLAASYFGYQYLQARQGKKPLLKKSQ